MQHEYFLNKIPIDSISFNIVFFFDAYRRGLMSGLLGSSNKCLAQLTFTFSKLTIVTHKNV